MTLTDAPLEDGLSEVTLDARTHLMRVRGDASLITHELRSAASTAVAAGRTGLVVDLLAATDVGGPLAWELSRAHERLLWRAGRVVVISEYSGLESLFDAFGLHRSPDVVSTLDAGLAAVNVSRAGTAVAHGSAFGSAPAPASGPPGKGAGASEPPPFTWRRHESVPASWSFELPGGPEAPGIARAAAGRILTGRLDEPRRREALLLVSEAVTNSVLHGGAAERERIELTVAVTGENVRVEVTDPVGGFEPPERPTDDLRTAGRGLPIIHSLARSWGVQSPPGGALWFELECAAA